MALCPSGDTQPAVLRPPARGLPGSGSGIGGRPGPGPGPGSGSGARRSDTTGFASSGEGKQRGYAEIVTRGGHIYVTADKLQRKKGWNIPTGVFETLRVKPQAQPFSGGSAPAFFCHLVFISASAQWLSKRIFRTATFKNKNESEKRHLSVGNRCNKTRGRLNANGFFFFFCIPSRTALVDSKLTGCRWG